MSNYGAGLLIYRPEDGRLLLTRRSREGSNPGVWDTAGGGVEAGETVMEAAIREGVEELGGLPRLKVETEPVWWAPNPYFAFALFIARMERGQKAWKPALNEEHDAYGWFSRGDLPRPHLPAIDAAVRYLSRSARRA